MAANRPNNAAARAAATLPAAAETESVEMTPAPAETTAAPATAETGAANPIEQQLLDQLKAANARIAELTPAPATPPKRVEFLEPFDVVLAQKCGALELGEVIGQVRLRKGVSSNFLVDAVRSGICQRLAQ